MSAVNATDFVCAIMTHAFREWLSVKQLLSGRPSIRTTKIFAFCWIDLSQPMVKWPSTSMLYFIRTILNDSECWEHFLWSILLRPFCLALVVDGVRCERAVFSSLASFWPMPTDDRWHLQFSIPLYSPLLNTRRCQLVDLKWNNFSFVSICSIAFLETDECILYVWSFGVNFVAKKKKGKIFLSPFCPSSKSKRPYHGKHGRIYARNETLSNIMFTCMQHDTYMPKWLFLFCCRRIIE